MGGVKFTLRTACSWQKSLFKNYRNWFLSPFTESQISDFICQFPTSVNEKLWKKSFVWDKKGSFQPWRINLLVALRYKGMMSNLDSILRITTTCLQRPQFWNPNLGFYNINQPLNNDQLSMTAINLGPRGWLLQTQIWLFTHYFVILQTLKLNNKI